MPSHLRAFHFLIMPILVVVAIDAKAANQFDWKSTEPSVEGISPEKLIAYRDALAHLNTEELIVIRHDHIILEWYAKTWDAKRPHGTASLAKAMIGGMSLAVAMQDGSIKPDDCASQFIPEWREDPAKSRITIGQLATHTSGLDDAESGETPHNQLTGWKGEFWKRGPRDPFTVSRDSTPLIMPSGTKISYSNPGMAMLSYAVTAAIQAGPNKDIRSLLSERLFKLIGIGADEWSAGYGTTYHAGGYDLVANWGGAAFTGRAAARVGRLMLREGDWEGRQLLSKSIVRLSVTPPHVPVVQRDEPFDPHPGFGWWTNETGAWPGVPRDAYIGAGAGHQLLLVIPSLDLIVVRFGTAMSQDSGYWKPVHDNVLLPVVQAVVDPPYPPGDVIRSVQFDPATSILRKAIDSDNWPITWGDDDKLYTSYGDGRGFEPFVDQKLSLGIAVVEGSPPDFVGLNIRSKTAERTGGGAKGPKASGMLMIDGTLYMWVRNTQNATIARSFDRGVTWEWGFKFEESFGCPTFLNFGKNGAGASDQYVYTYSQDSSNAYEPCDGVVLARVIKTGVMDKSAYTYFAGVAPDGSANWSTDITKRKHVFYYPGHCERLDVVYDATLARYLMAVSFGQGKGWGIFDSASPYGPWTTTFCTSDWGMGETHGYRLPTKWVSADATRRWLIFSGRNANDAFCVRGMTFELYPKRPSTTDR